MKKCRDLLVTTEEVGRPNTSSIWKHQQILFTEIWQHSLYNSLNKNKELPVAALNRCLFNFRWSYSLLYDILWYDILS